jgi:ribosomal protein L32
MTEIQRIYDAEPVSTVPSMEELKSEWTVGAAQKLAGQLRQARAAAMLKTHYGAKSIEGFAKEMNTSASTVYEYARAWRRLLETFESEHEIYGRLEDSPLRISQVIESGRDEDMARSLDEAEDDNLSSKAQRERRRERSEPKNVQLITHMVCPECGALSPMSRVETREMEA